MEQNPIIRFLKKNFNFLQTLDIIRSSIKLCLNNPTFIFFTILTSLPAYFVMLVHELTIQYLLSEASIHITFIYPDMVGITARGIRKTLTRILQVSFLYAIPFMLLNVLTAVTTIYTASAIYTAAWPATMRTLDMIHISFTKTRWKKPLITLIYTSVLSSASYVVVAIYALAIDYFTRIGMPYLAIWAMEMCLIVVILKWLLQYNAVCLMSVVVSVLEDKKGLEAILVSSQLSKDDRNLGSSLLAQYSVWSFGLCVPSFFIRGSFYSRIAYAFVQTALLCLVKIMKWVVFMVYYHHCKRKSNKSDLEGGMGYSLLNEPHST